MTGVQVTVHATAGGRPLISEPVGGGAPGRPGGLDLCQPTSGGRVACSAARQVRPGYVPVAATGGSARRRLVVRTGAASSSWRRPCVVEQAELAADAGEPF